MRYSKQTAGKSKQTAEIIQIPQALNAAGAGIGGTVIVVSQGKTTSLALNEEKDLTDLAAKHRLKIFSVAIPRQPQVRA